MTLDELLDARGRAQVELDLRYERWLASNETRELTEWINQLTREYLGRRKRGAALAPGPKGAA